MAAVSPASTEGPDLHRLWSIPWSFTQRGLLSPSQFETECGIRGLSFRPGQLEALDQLGILRPIFEIDGRLAADRLQPNTRAVGAALVADQINNRLRQPKAEWPRSSEAPTAVYYSWYQLLAVPRLDQFLKRLALTKDSDPLRDTYRWHYSEDDREWLALHPLPLVPENLIFWLSVLDTVFLPLVGRQASMPFLAELPEERPYTTEEMTELHEAHQREFEQYRRKVPTAELLGATQATPEELAHWVDRLFFMANDVDPLGEWLHVIRLAPLRWKYLRREALVAMDYRIAGEMLLRFLDRVAEDGLADRAIYGVGSELAKRHAEHRLQADESKLEGILADFDISPHPLVIVVLEGKTEMVLAPRIIAELGLPAPPHPVRLQNGKSTDSPLTWVYRYAWGFEIHEEIYGGFRPSRALPYIFCLSDPEGTRETPEGRERLRQTIIKLLKEDAEEVAGRPLPAELFDSRVQVIAWPKSFEFSHFSLDELAAGLRVLEPGLDQRLEAALSTEATRYRPRSMQCGTSSAPPR